MPAASTKPTIVLIPGGYNSVGPDPNVDIPAYKSFNDALRHAGYPVVSVPYPSLTHTDPSTTDAKSDASFIRDQLLLPRIEQGERIILVMHSYGSIPACAAAKGLSILQHRKVGKMGGVLGMVFISAFILTEGKSIVDGCEGGDLPDWVHQNYPAPGLATPREPVYRFCHELEGQGRKSL